jgi:aminoglycoside phosphotransferase (APT) family kinase protein
MSRAADFSGTTEVRAEHRFDQERLADWMKANVAGFAGPLTVRQFKGGQSNPTYRLLTATASYVLRRKPPGHLLKGAHAVEREVQVLTALHSAAFPVPRVQGLCTDEAVIGTWFYVMDHIEGRIFWDMTLPDVARDQRPRYFEAMIETLARLHSLDYQAIGLADYGRPGNYFERQIARWSKQYLGDLEAGRDPHMDRLIEWLPAHLPPGDETRIVHGDFRVDNMIFHPSEPRVLAVLDWELSTLGHPLADFSYHLMMYRMPPMVTDGLKGADLAALNIPSESEYVAAYCRLTGRADIPHLDFYLAFNLFRFAAIAHGIKGRLARGTASSPYAIRMTETVPVLAGLAWQQAEIAAQKQ